VALPRAYAPVSIALWVTGARKPPLHAKVVVLEDINNTLNKFTMSTACFDNTRSSPYEVKHMRAIGKLTSGELLTKQAMREKKMFLYTKNPYILKLLFKIVTRN
jgi:hypothetical protein